MEKLDFITVLTPVLLTIVTSIILWKQYTLDREKYKVKFFNKRYRLFIEARSLILNAIKTLDVKSNDWIKLAQLLSDYQIFFNKRTYEILDQIDVIINDLRRVLKEGLKKDLEEEKLELISMGEQAIIIKLSSKFREFDKQMIKNLNIKV